MNENLGQVSALLGNLRNMAIDISQELEHQNEMIGIVKRKVIAFNYLYFSTIIIAHLRV